MLGVWTITYGGQPEQSCAAAGLTAAPRIRTRDRSPTEISFRMAGAAPEGGVPFGYYPALLATGSTVAAAEAAARVVIKHYSGSAGGSPAGSVLYTFVGYLSNYPADLDGKSQGISVIFKDALWLLQNTTFQQLWKFAAAPTTPGYISRCVLFMDINSWVPNLVQTVQWQLQQIIAYAATCGIYIQAGTIDYSGWLLNYYHCRALSCWDALLKCLEPICDAKIWIDGSQTPPALNLRTRANLAAMSAPAGTAPGPITLVYRGKDATGRVHHSSQGFVPRYDLVIPQVVLQYQIANTINGKAAPTWTNDVYPATVGGSADGQMPFALVCPIDLTGANEVVETGTLDCEPLMCTAAQTGCASGSAADHAAKRAWWGSHRGGAQHKLVNQDGTQNYCLRFQSNTGVLAAIGDATVTDQQNNPVNLAQYPNRIVSGTYHAWMQGIVAIRVKIQVKVQFAEYDLAGSTPAETDTNGRTTRKATSDTFTFDATLTNAAPGVTPYVGTYYTSLAESPVPNLAQNIYTSREVLDYDGSHEIIDPGIANGASPTAPLSQIIGHWNVLNFSGAGVPPAWTTANMTIASTEIDMMTNHVRIEVGPSKHLQPQDWAGMFNFFRYRRTFMISSVRATGYGDASSNVDMPLNTADANTVPGLAVEQQASQLTYNTPGDPTSGVAGQINHDSSLIQTTLAATTPTPYTGFSATDIKTMQPREIKVCDDSGNPYYIIVHATGGYTKPA
jgi:hypothetical protein